VRFFVQRFAKKFGKNVEAVPRETMNSLERYPWNGNIRELQNVIERAVVLSAGPVLALNDSLLPTSSEDRSTDHTGTANITSRAPNMGPSSMSLEEFERNHIRDVLEKFAWVVEGPRGAAKSLAVNPNTLRSKMKKLGIRRPDHEIS